MREMLFNIGVPSHHWLQHNLPWLAVLALVFGLDRDPGEDRGADRDV